MCSPAVMQFLKKHFKQEGLQQTRTTSSGGIARRDFLKLGGAALAGAVVGSQMTAPSRAFAQGNGTMQVIDLTQPLTDTAPTFPSFDAPSRESLYTVEDDGFYAQVWSFAEHAATHMDAPGHFIAGGALVPELDPANFFAPLVVIDIAARAEEDVDAQVTPDDIMAYESENGEIPPGAFVAMHSGWETKYTDVEAFRGTDDAGVLHFPGFHPEAADMLVNERELVGVGVDTLSLDYGPSTDFASHITFLGAGLYGIENMANLMDVAGTSATVFVGIPIYQAGSGGPCRVLAMVDSSTS